MFVCPRCGKVLVSKQAHTYHMNRKRPCVERFVCTCSLQFKTKFDLYIHRINCKSNGVQTIPKEEYVLSPTSCVVMMDGSGGIKEIKVMDKTFTSFQVISNHSGEK